MKAEIEAFKRVSSQEGIFFPQKHGQPKRDDKGTPAWLFFLVHPHYFWIFFQLAPEKWDGTGKMIYFLLVKWSRISGERLNFRRVSWLSSVFLGVPQ